MATRSENDRVGSGAVPLEPEWWLALTRGDYLHALARLRAAVDENEPISYDPLAYLLQAVGRFADADAICRHRAALESPRGLQALPEELRLALARASHGPGGSPPETSPDQALAVLVEAVSTRRVVMLGEEHHHPEHRAFGARALAALRAAGVTHLAVEANHQERKDEARRSGRITPTTDGFAFEPQRAALLRSALRLDLPIVAFDVDERDMSWMQSHPQQALAYRERAMAEHIVERILGPRPDARVVVWVGHGHAQKVDLGVKMMALHLWEITGDEPFCAYQLTGEGSRPGVDVLIRHPEPTYLRARPDWLRVDRQSVQGSIEPPAACLVQLHPASEGPASTPTDQLLTGEDGQFELLVPPDDYLLRVWTAAGHVSQPRPLAVRGDLHDVRIPP